MKKFLILVVAMMMIVSCVAFAACDKSTINVGVQAGTTGELFVKGDADWGFDGLDYAKCSAYANAGLAVSAMKSNLVDVVIVDEAPAKYLVKSTTDVAVIDVALTDEKYAFGVNKDDADLLASINAFLATASNDGTMDAIFAKYFDDNQTITPITSSQYDASKSQLVVATNAAFAPFEYKIGENFAGIDMEIAKLIADSLGMELVIQDMDFDAVVTSVGKNGVDVAMAGLTVNDERAKVVNFSNTYYTASQMVICKKADEAKFANCTDADSVLAVLKAF